MMNDDIRISPTERYSKWLWGLGLILAFTLIGVMILYFGSMAGILILLLPFFIMFAVATFNKPVVAVYMLLFYSFFVFFFARYFIKDVFPSGILYDGLLVYAYMIVFLKGLSGKIEWARLKDAPILILSVWLIYCILSLLNPESPGFDAWLYAFRVHMYMALSIPLFCLLIDVRSLKTMIILWGVFSMILTLKGFMQLNIRLDHADELFLAQNYTTHILWGKLRVFSFCSDAGQFGVQQAHAAVIGGILFLGAKNAKQRLFFLLMAFTGLYGMFISGTRGAIFVIFGAALAYCALVRKVKLLILAIILGGGFYYFMAFTNIGHSVYSIHRMRSAFRPGEDASYIVRKNNQAKLKTYLASRPLGGGLGSMGFGPSGSPLREIPSDSGYVLTWGDQGIIGLCMYIAMFLFFLFKGAQTVWFKIKNEWLRGVLIALIAGISGDAIAHYGNAVMLQHPTSTMIFLSIAVIYIAPRLDKAIMQEDEVAEKQTTSHIIKRGK